MVLWDKVVILEWEEEEVAEQDIIKKESNNRRAVEAFTKEIQTIPPPTTRTKEKGANKQSIIWKMI